MLLPGMEEKYIKYMRSLSSAATASYKTKDDQLNEGTWVRYFKKPDAFGKSRGSTLSEPVQIVKRHTYAYATDQSTRQGPIKKNMIVDSYEVTGTTQRFLPYQLVLVNKK